MQADSDKVHHLIIKDCFELLRSPASLRNKTCPDMQAKGLDASRYNKPPKVTHR